MAQLPYVPDDQRYYDSLDKSGDLQRHYQDLMAEENVANITAQGQNAANAISSLPGNIEGGANFAMNRAQNQQNMDIRGSEESRAQQRFVPEMEAFGLENKLRGEDLNQRGIKTEEQLHQRSRARGADPVSAKALGFSPDMTREDMEYAQAQRQSGANLAATRAGTSATQMGTATAGYDLGHRQLTDEAPGWEGAPPAGPATGGLSVSNLITPPPSGAVTFAGGIPHLAEVEQPKNAGGQPPPVQMSDAEAAAIAQKHNARNPLAHVTPEAVKAAARNVQQQRLAAARQMAVEKETQAALTPDITAARQKASDTAAKIGTLADMVEQNVKGYDKAAGKGGTGVIGTLAGLAGVKSLGQHGVGESGTQSRYRNEVVGQLRNMGLNQEADNLEGARLASVPQRMQEGINAAMRKAQGDLRALITANPSLQDDRKIQDAIRAANMAIQKYNNELTGKSTLNLTGGGKISDAMMKGIQ